MTASTRYQTVLCALAALSLAACGGGGGSNGGASNPSMVAATSSTATPAATSSPNAPDGRSFDQSDREIAALVYDGRVRTPDGFYSEAPVDIGRPVATRHLQNREIDEAARDHARFEVCTDDWNQALEWSEIAAKRDSRYGNLVETKSGDRFFEFVRQDPSSIETPLLRQRVYRCSYVNRSATDLDTFAGAGGKLGQVPVQTADLRELAEYSWQFTTFNNFGNVVLASAIVETDVTVEHEMRMATLVRDGLGAGCDRIDLVAWTHVADRASGAVTRELQTLRHFGAREIPGGVETCTQN
jgi:hypothetical protein